MSAERRLPDLLAEYAKSRRVYLISITLPMASQPRILRLLNELRDTTASIYFVPDIFVFDLIQARMDSINGIPVEHERENRRVELHVGRPRVEVRTQYVGILVGDTNNVCCR